MWGPAPDPYHLHSICTWFGAYPAPNLTWGEDRDDGSGGKKGHVYELSVADSLSLTLNRSELFDGQTLKCAAQHPVLAPGEEHLCSFTLSKHVAVAVVVVKRSSRQSWDVPLLNLLCSFQFRGVLKVN